MSVISEESAKEALAQLGGKGTFTEIARRLQQPVRGPRTEPLKHTLKKLVAEQKVLLKGSTYALRQDSSELSHLPSKVTPEVLQAVESGADRIIESIDKLKKDLKYPAAPREIAESAGYEFNSLFTSLLAGLVEGEALQTHKSGRVTKYLFAADDSRYALKATEQLKFELLEEIRNLRCRIELLPTEFAEKMKMTVPEKTAVERHAEPIPDGMVERILQAIRKISKKKKRRTVLICDLRSELKDLDSKTFEAALEALGNDLRIELHLLQDGTRLNPKLRQGLLPLSDGRLIASAALSEE